MQCSQTKISKPLAVPLLIPLGSMTLWLTLKHCKSCLKLTEVFLHTVKHTTTIG